LRLTDPHAHGHIERTADRQQPGRVDIHTDWIAN
jgi:hypothetical protein